MSLFDQQQIQKEVHAIEALESSSLVRNLVRTITFSYTGRHGGLVVERRTPGREVKVRSSLM